MKSQHLLPVLAAAIGFAVAWTVKPAPAPVTTTATNGKTAAKPANRPENNRTRPAAISEKRPKEVKAGDFPLSDLADQGPKTRTEAKMLRLTEALDLSIDQQGEIISALEKAKAAESDSVPVIQDLAKRGNEIQDALEKILTPEQLAKFEELRVRERENRIEARAQRALSQTIEEVDLSPGQRDEVLARLRQYSKEQIQAIPAAATLLLNTSMLPTDSKDLNVDSVLMLTRISEEPPAPDDPLAAHQIVLKRQRQELEERLQCFDGILTAGQMGQVHAAVAEKRTTLETLRQKAAEVEAKAMTQAPPESPQSQAPPAAPNPGQARPPANTSQPPTIPLPPPAAPDAAPMEEEDEGFEPD